MLTRYGQKRIGPAGAIIEYPPEQQTLYMRWRENLKDGQMVKTVDSIYRPHKTWNQVKNHFGNAMRLLVQTFDDRGWDVSMLYRLEKPTGVPVTIAMFQQFFYAMFPTCNDEGKLITMSSADFTTEHCSTLFEAIRNYAASQWSIVIPDPDPNWRERPEQGAIR
jgi:hypothetical protein